MKALSHTHPKCIHNLTFSFSNTPFMYFHTTLWKDIVPRIFFCQLLAMWWMHMVATGCIYEPGPLEINDILNFAARWL